MTDFEVGMELIEAAQMAKWEENIFQRWITGYQHVYSFEEFIQHVGGRPSASKEIEEETVEEILVGVREIMNGNI